MRQEVTVGPDIIDYYYECGMDITNPDDFGPFFIQLREDIVMWNSELEDSLYEKIINEYIANESEAMSLFWGDHLPKLNKKEVEDLDEIKLTELTHEDKIEYALVKASKDKIWLKSEENKKRLEIRDHEKRKGKSPKTIKEKKKLYGSLVLPISFNDYSRPNPDEGDNILRLNYMYKHDPNDYFPFNSFIKILLTDTKRIRILEPYIYQTTGVPKSNLEFIFSLVPESTPIQIATMAKEKYGFLKDKVRCSACGWLLKTELFDNHIEGCKKAKFSTPIDVKPSDKIKMVRCSACQETMIEKDEEFNDHVEECPDRVIPTAIKAFDPIKELMNELKSKYDNLTFTILKKHERRIYTDEFIITLGAGLGSYKDGKVVYNDSSFFAEKK